MKAICEAPQKKMSASPVANDRRFRPSPAEPLVAAVSVRDDRHARWALLAAVLGFFIVTFDAVVVNVALPSIRRDFGGGVSGLQWVVDGYTLMFAALLLGSGSLSDRIGARRAFAGGLVVFALASAGCGVAPNFAVLVAARFVQGSGAAVIMPASMALLRHAFPDAGARGRAVAIWAMGGAMASSSGPVLGGVLSLASWRLIFLINLPVAAVTLRVLARTVPSPAKRVAFDWAGQLTAALAMAGVVFGVIEGGSRGFTQPDVIAALTVAAVALACFVAVQARVEHPMVPLELFRSARFNISVVIGFAFMVGYYGTPFLFSLYFQNHRGLSPLLAGVAFLPMMLVGGVLTPFSARIVERTGPRAPVVAGLIALAAGAAALAAVPASTPVWTLAILLMLVGLAGPLVMPPTIAVLLTSVPAHQSGVASGVFNTSRQVGGALAVAVFGALTAASGGFGHGQRISLTIVAAVAVATAAAALGLLSHSGSEAIS